MFRLEGTSKGDYGESKSDSDFERSRDLWTNKQRKIAGKLYRKKVSPGIDDPFYSGQPTDIEQMGLDFLRQYGRGAGELMGQGSDALSRALTGQGYQDIVDPAAAERLYGAIEQRTMKDILPKAIEAAGTQANVGGMLRGGTGQQLMTDEIGRITRGLSGKLADLKYGDEQARRQVAMDRERRQLQGLSQMGQQFGAIQPMLQYGGMERDIYGTKYDNPAMRLAMAYLGLRGREDMSGSASGKRTGWNIGQSFTGGLGMG